MILSDWLKNVKKSLRIAAAPSPQFYFTINKIMDSWTEEHLTRQKGDLDLTVSTIHNVKLSLLDIAQAAAIASSSAKGVDPTMEESASNVLDVLENIVPKVHEITLE